MKLIIVESPSKCQKIEKACGPGYKCLSSYGHIYELKKGLAAIDINNTFEPSYQTISSKKPQINKLKKAKSQSTEIFIASDPDREGEVIALHLAQELKIIKKCRRITFNEISKSAIQTALKNPRKIDIPLCEAQKARRVLDRLIGFEISPLLWNNINSNGKSLSAGRCQSPALNLIAEKELAIEKFETNPFYLVYGKLNYKGKRSLEVTSSKEYKSIEDCHDLLKHCLECQYQIKNIKYKESTSKPSPPFTTSSLQQEASQKLGMNPKRTMDVAQKLYENGYITYMRTDSTSIGEDAYENIENHINGKYGEQYYQKRNYQSKVKNAQEAHECIRNVNFDEVIADSEQEKLYQLILNRTLASQMKNKLTQVQEIEIEAILDDKKYYFFGKEEKTLFDGFTILFNLKDKPYHKWKIGQILLLDILETKEKQKTGPTRYTEAGLVKELEKSGIGRPSTFSNIISTLFDKGYVEKGKSKGELIKRKVLFITTESKDIQKKIENSRKNGNMGKLMITKLGLEVLKFLSSHFQNLLDKNLTGEMEDYLDKVALGEVNWVQVVREYYDSFHPQVVTLSRNSKKIDSSNIQIEWILKYGEDSGKIFGIINNKYGKCLVSNSDEGNKYLPIVDTLYKDGSSLTLEQVINMFNLPLSFTINKIKYSLHYGRYGYYIKKDESSDIRNIEGSWNDNIVPSQEQIEQLFTEKKSKVLKEIGKYKIINGKYGPCILYNKKFYKIPSSVDIDKIDKKKCIELCKIK